MICFHFFISDDSRKLHHLSFILTIFQILITFILILIPSLLIHSLILIINPLVKYFLILQAAIHYFMIIFIIPLEDLIIFAELQNFIVEFLSIKFPFIQFKLYFAIIVLIDVL